MGVPILIAVRSSEFSEKPPEIVLALFQGRVMCPQAKFLGTKLLASGNPCEVGQGLWSWRWETSHSGSTGWVLRCSLIQTSCEWAPDPIQSITKGSREDYWAPILGSLTLIRSSNIPNIDDTAWESVEEEGRGQGGSCLLKVKIIEWTFYYLSAVGSSVSGSNVCHCKNFFLR